MKGDFFFEQENRADSAKIVRLGVANLEVTWNGQGITNGSGAFVILDNGGTSSIAGIASGEALGCRGRC